MNKPTDHGALRMYRDGLERFVNPYWRPNPRRTSRHRSLVQNINDVRLVRCASVAEMKAACQQWIVENGGE